MQTWNCIELRTGHILQKGKSAIPAVYELEEENVQFCSVPLILLYAEAYDPGERKRAAGKAALSVSFGRGGISGQQHLHSDDHEEHYGIEMVKPAEFF